jgi:benzil reductase ((S)-benzoin forming)
MMLYRAFISKQKSIKTIGYLDYNVNVKEGDRMNYTIITGTTRGLGFELVKACLNQGDKVISISRQLKDELAAEGKLAGEQFRHFDYDLEDSLGIGGLMDQIFEEVNLAEASRVTLISNAGDIEPIAPFYKADDLEVLESLSLNLIAPMMLARHFGRLTREIGHKAQFFVISSGAGRNPVYGWNSYCAAKAGVDMMTRVIAVEEGAKGLQTIAFGPGVMDTGMQQTIRSSSVHDFRDVEKFRKYKTDNVLRKPEAVAAVVLTLVNDGFEQGGIVNVADFEVKR